MAPRQDEIPENDGNDHLRHKIRQICSTTATHEERGQQLRDLMTESFHKACEVPPPSAKNGKVKFGLPEKEKYEPRLQELPAELIENIAVNLALKDFGNLRLVSRVLHRDSTHAFRKMFFSRRAVRMEWESLRRLVNILNDPHCGPALRHLTIDCEKAAEDASGSSRGAPHVPHGGLGRRARPSYQPQALLTSSSRRLQELLERAFSRIERLQSLSLTSHPSSVVEGEEHNAYLQTFRRLLAREHLTMVLEAIAQGCTRISHLRIGGSPKHREASFDYFELSSLDAGILAQNQVGLRRAFRHMIALDVVVYSDVADGPLFEDLRRKADFVVQLLKSTPNLQTLNLCLGPPGLGGGITCVVSDLLSRSIKLPRLEKCVLHSLGFTTPILRKFLSSSPAIKEVHLDRIYLSEDSTEELFHLLGNEIEIQRGSIRSMLSVISVGVKSVRDVDWEPRYPPRWVGTEIDLAALKDNRGAIAIFP